MMKAFWQGFEKRADLRDDNIKSLDIHAQAFKKIHKTIAGAHAVGGAALLGHGLYKNNPATGIVGGAVGLLGAHALKGPGRYSTGLTTIKKHLAGEKVTDAEWDHLAMFNPSGSLMEHVHPALRREVAEPWTKARKRVFGHKKEARLGLERVLDYSKMLRATPRLPGSVIDYSSGKPVMTAFQKAVSRPKIPRVTEAEKSLRRLENARKGSAPRSAWQDAMKA